MKGVLTLCTALVVLAVLRVALVVLAVTFSIMLLFFLVTQPRETLTYLGSLLLMGLVSERPVAVIVSLGAAAVILSLTEGRRKNRRAPLLTPGRLQQKH